MFSGDASVLQFFIGFFCLYKFGPSLDKALVGTTTQNYFLLNGSCSDGVSGRKETGIKHYYLVDLISCKNTCVEIFKNKTDVESFLLYILKNYF